MTISHVITESDTLQSLAEEYLGDSNRWYELAEYNYLDAPYLVTTTEEKEDRYSSGYVKVTRVNYTGSIVVRKGWTFKTKPYLIGGIVKTFEVTKDLTVPSGTKEFYVHVKCKEAGTYGNVIQGIITQAGKEFKDNGIAIESVTNEESFEGGRDVRLLTVGDIIHIPTDEIDFIANEDIYDQLALIGGEDLLLYPATGYERTIFSDNFGDLRSISGIDNIKQAVNDRLMTEKGELPLHPEYGTNLPLIIGSKRTPYTEKLIQIEIYDALSYEDRITDVEIVDMKVEGTSIEVVVKFRPTATTTDTLFNLSLSF